MGRWAELGGGVWAGGRGAEGGGGAAPVGGWLWGCWRVWGKRREGWGGEIVRFVKDKSTTESESICVADGMLS